MRVFLSLFVSMFIHFFSYAALESKVDISAWDHHKIIGYIVKVLSKPITKERLLDAGPLIISNRLLLYGPPGNGKTTLAREIAAAADCEFVHIRASSIVTRYQGSGSENMQKELMKAFDKILEGNRPVVIFIDEVDAIAIMGNGDSSRVDHSNAVQELWQYLDTCKTDPRVFIICATNQYEKLNLAFVSRFPEQQRLKIDQPDQQMREKVLLSLMEKYDFTVYRHLLNDLVDHGNGMSIRELENFIYEIRLHVEFETLLTDKQVIEKIKAYPRGYKEPNNKAYNGSSRDIYDNIHLMVALFSIMNTLKTAVESGVFEAIKNSIGWGS